MTDRHRPRLNITLDPELKNRVEDVADELDLSVSRLIEDVLFEFVELFEDDPMAGVRLKKSVSDRKKQESKSRGDERAKKEIEEILQAMEESENDAKN